VTPARAFDERGSGRHDLHMAAGGIFAFVIAAVIAFAIWSYKRNQTRVRALQQYAAANGWAYVGRDDRQCMRWQQPPFNDGFDRRALNVLTGHHRGHNMVAFDYVYKTRTSDGRGNSSTQTHRYRVCALAMQTFLPSLEVGPENVLTRLRNVMGMHDIELESATSSRCSSSWPRPRTGSPLAAASTTATCGR